jgi:hypothetical protein
MLKFRLNSMKKKQTKKSMDTSLIRVTRTLYFFIGIFALSIVIFDAGNLITREAVSQRWLLMVFLLGSTTAAWLLGSVDNLKTPVTYGLVVAYIAAAGLITYWERGMASASSIMYALPLLICATLKNRHILIATAVASTGTYSLAAVKYFNDYFNEGYRVQLWGTLLFIGGTIFVLTWLILIVVGLRHDSK